MNNIFKYIMLVCAMYFAINWVADNPTAMRIIRNKMNKSVEEGHKLAQSEIESVVQSLDN
jgi:uncharacterized membrane-anchored protein